MSGSQSSGWRFNLVFFILLCSFAACAFLTWERRTAWHVAATMPGQLLRGDDLSRDVPGVFDPEKGIITVGDTLQRIQLPAELRGKIQVSRFHPSRTSFDFTKGEETELRCWDLVLGHEVPVSRRTRDDLQPTPSGTRYLIMDLSQGESRRFQVLRLDGSVLHERVLPALDDRSADVQHTFSAEGKFLAVSYSDSRRIHLTRIYDMATEASWPYPDRFGAVSDEGIVWLKDASLNIDRSNAQILRAVRLDTGVELWRAAVTDGVTDVVYFGSDRLGVASQGSGAALYEAKTGRSLGPLEKMEGSLRDIQVHRGGPKSYLVDPRSVWSLETGRRIPIAGDLPQIEFFDDGCRALIHLKCGWPGRVVELETGKELIQFREPGQIVGPYVQRAGERVLVSDWDRVTDAPLPIQVWERRYSEGWKGHLLRPEIYAAVFVGAAMLVLWANRPRHESLPGASQG